MSENFASSMATTLACPQVSPHLRAYRFGTRKCYYILYLMANYVQDIVDRTFTGTNEGDLSGMQANYPQSKTNRVRQLREKASYDRETVQLILDAGIVAHVAFTEDGSAVVVPMIYGREGDRIYLHGARKARVIRLLEQNDRVCLNVTLLDGLVLARSAFNSSMEYRSVTVFGKPSLVEGSDNKLHAMRTISEHSMPGRWDELRDPLDREVKMTGVIALDIETASAKISNSGVADEEHDYAIPIWAGVLPITAKVGALADDERLIPGVAPSAAVKNLQGRMI